MTVWTAREGYGIPAAEASRIGPELEEMAGLSDRESVQYIRERPQMFLFHRLIWDNREAGQLFRERQIKYYRRGVIMIHREVHEAAGISPIPAAQPARPAPSQRRTKRRAAREATPTALAAMMGCSVRRLLNRYRLFRAAIEGADARFKPLFAALEAFLKDEP